MEVARVAALRAAANGAEDAATALRNVAELPLMILDGARSGAEAVAAAVCERKGALESLGMPDTAAVLAAVARGDEDVCARVLQLVVAPDGPLGAPTLCETDARFIRAWEPREVLTQRQRLYPEIVLRKHAEPQLLRVKTVVWHKYRQRVAVVLSTDQARVFDVLNETWDEQAGVLEHDFQTGVAAAEWQPRSGASLALGCEHGVCLWSSGLQWMSFLPCEQPVEALAWAPSGLQLATASSRAATITIWDVATRKPTSLRRMLGAVSELLWAPSGHYLYSGSVGLGFRLWETLTWDCELYSQFAQPVQTACWGGDGRTLLLATGGKAEAKADAKDAGGGEGALEMYAVALAHEPPRIDGVVLPMSLSLSSVVASESMLGRPARRVRQLAFNDTSERLAVCYEGGPGVAVYAAHTHPSLRFFFVGHVWGPPGSMPMSVAFKPKFERGALLCAVFEDLHSAEFTGAHAEASARTTVRFVPMYF